VLHAVGLVRAREHVAGAAAVALRVRHDEEEALVDAVAKQS
jgi:hypothetical protein